MSQMKRILYKLRLKKIWIENQIYNHFLKSNSSITIVSSPNYQNKVKEDLYLQKYILKRGIHCQIETWNDTKEEDLSVIRSVWGYHKNLEVFKKYLEKHKTINPKKMILDNMDKKKQYELLKEYSIPLIDTEFLSRIDEYTYQDKKVVIKPVVSAGGDDTYLIQDEKDLETCKGLENIMIQPYIEEINEGEISVIIIGRELLYGIVRYPGVLQEYHKEKYMRQNELPSSILDISKRIIDLDCYLDASFMRIDFLRNDRKYVVLEVELIDPDLFIEAIPDKKLKIDIYQKFVDTILKKLK